jgi:hypothetical protein
VGYSSILPVGPIYLGSPTVITQTNPVSTAGLYYVSASAMVAIDRGDAGIFCYDTTANTGIQSQYAGSYSVGEIHTLSITDALNLGAGHSAEMVCYSVLADNGSYVNNAGLTATLIHSGSVRLMAGKHSHAPSDSVERSSNFLGFLLRLALTQESPPSKLVWVGHS